MADYHSIKKKLLTLNQDALSLLKKGTAITEKADSAIADWEATCRNIHTQLSEEMVRVAVVGPIKSGKSTFINSVLQGDYLKRGAGVVTSIVTRVRWGNHLNAKLFFKSWDEVNWELNQALTFFPSLNWRTENDGFDIRRKKERIELEQALDVLGAEHLITRNSRVANSVVLSAYLKGYDLVKDVISTHAMTRQYGPDQFENHWRFISNESLAVYLKDVELEIDAEGIDANIEIADCQGSDSPNPLHLAMIQDYLLLTHLLIYVISSRTGLREADIKFLYMIKKMGILDNIIFIVNCDFSEHESIDDLKSLLGKVAEELALIKTEPDVYSLSALFNLFKARHDNLPEKDLNRLHQWQDDIELVRFSESETDRFAASFNKRLGKERYALLLKNHLERLAVIITGMDHWIRAHKHIVTRDAVNTDDIIAKIGQHQDRINHVKSMIKHTLDGGIQKIKNELKVDVDRFFDVRSGKILRDITEFIKDYKVSPDRYEANLKASGFSNTLYFTFQEFKQSLDSFMAEVINPEIIRFVKAKEIRIQEDLASIADPFAALMQEVVVEYNRMSGEFGTNHQHGNNQTIDLPSIDPIKDITGLTIPPAAASMKYTARIKTEAVMRLGFYTVVKLFKRLLRKPLKSRNEEEIRALKDAIARMKHDTERSIVFHFKDYRENLKYQYIFKLVEALANSYYQALLNRFRAHVADLSDIVDLIDNEKVDKEKAFGVLQEMELSSEQIKNRIRGIRQAIESTI